MIAGNLKFGAAESFNKGTAPTFLEATQAKKVRNFINAFDRFTFRLAPGKSDLIVANNGVILSLGYEEKDITVCEDGEEKTYTILVKV